VGGVCANEQNVGLADQMVNVTAYSNEIDNGDYQVWYGGYLRTWAANNDNPQLAVEFINASGQVISSTPFTGNTQPSWLLVQQLVPVPPLTRRIKLVLKGTRNSGTDNDSYFDELFLKLTTLSACPTCFGSSGTDIDHDGFCSDIDCDDNDALQYPGAAENCDGTDNNCDNVADNGNTVTWTGNGDGLSWEDPANWNQNLVPLPCQHVYILLQDSVVIENYQAVKSLKIGNLAKCTILENARLMIDSGQENGISSLWVQGMLQNSGRMDVTRSDENGLLLEGTLHNSGRIYINGVELHNILSIAGSQLINEGLLLNK
jgi:hypothetical protein